jgi:hypothetical protein
VGGKGAERRGEKRRGEGRKVGEMRWIGKGRLVIQMRLGEVIDRRNGSGAFMYRRVNG